MKRFMLIIVFVLLLFSGMSTSASDIFQERVSSFSVRNLPFLQDIYGLDNLFFDLPFVFVQIDHLLFKKILNKHAAAGYDSLYVLDSEHIVSFLKNSSSFDEFYRQVRVAIINYLIENNHTRFISKPYHWKINQVMFIEEGDIKFLHSIEEKDDLDVLLVNILSGFAPNFTDLQKYLSTLTFKSIDIDYQELSQLGNIYLFKQEQDLKDLGYELVSWRTRINTDRDYRRHNILAAFHNIGMVRVIIPGQVFSTLRELHYRPAQGGYPYVEGLVTVGYGAVMMHGGGLCGVSTALFQGILSNLSLSIVDYKAHSSYYRNLYEAEINGNMVNDPGLDATLFSPVFDLKFKNIREYPIILGFAFDGESGSEEQVFTLSKSQDKGSFEYVGSYKRGTYSCFTWKINGKNMTNCYKEVKNF